MHDHKKKAGKKFDSVCCVINHRCVQLRNMCVYDRRTADCWEMLVDQLIDSYRYAENRLFSRNSYQKFAEFQNSGRKQLFVKSL